MTTQIDMTNVIDGLFSQLTGNSNFNTAIGGSASSAGRVRYGQIDDRDLAMPFAVINLVSVNDFDSFTHDGYSAMIQLSVYSDAESSSARENNVIADKARERVHRQSITVSNHESMTSEVSQTRGPLREDNAWRTDFDLILRGRRS